MVVGPRASASCWLRIRSHRQLGPESPATPCQAGSPARLPAPSLSTRGETPAGRCCSVCVTVSCCCAGSPGQVPAHPLLGTAHHVSGLHILLELIELIRGIEKSIGQDSFFSVQISLFTLAILVKITFPLNFIGVFVENQLTL